MNGSVLSQEEINALLQASQSSEKQPDGETIRTIKNGLPVIKRSLSTFLSKTVEVQGIHTEPSSVGIAGLFSDSIYVYPASIGGVRLFTLIAEKDCETLKKALPRQLIRGVNMFINEWYQTIVSVISQELGSPHQLDKVYAPVKLALQNASSLPLQKEDYFVKTSITWENASIDLVLLVQQQFEKFMLDNGVKVKRSGVRLNRLPIRDIRFQDLEPVISNDAEQSVSLISDVELTCLAELGSCVMTLGEIMDLKTDSIIKLNKTAGEPADIYINGNPIAKGEVLVLDNNFGIRILEVVPVKTLMDNLA